MSLLGQEDAELRADLDHARAHLADLEAMEHRLAATRETALAMARKAADCTGTKAQQAAGTQTASVAVRVSHGRASDVIIDVIYGSGRSWRAREVADALGYVQASRGRVATVRNSLLRLTAAQLLVRTGIGLYAEPDT